MERDTKEKRERDGKLTTGCYKKQTYMTIIERTRKEKKRRKKKTVLTVNKLFL